MRGKVIDLCEEKGIDGITPAYAGKRDSLPRDSTPPGDHPRVCGEKLQECLICTTLWGSPPRMRGKVPILVCEFLCVGITPAYAGKSILIFMVLSSIRDHPRVCGEKGLTVERVSLHMGSPPRMRGKVNKTYFDGTCYRITPAYAGKSGTGSGPAPGPKDHPRVCGEKPVAMHSWTTTRGSPPRMRGKVFRSAGAAFRAGITPAYAGKR